MPIAVDAKLVKALIAFCRRHNLSPKRRWHYPMKAPTVSEMKVLTAPLAPLTGRIVIVTLVAVIALTVFHGIAGLLRHENLGLGYLPRSGLTLFWLLTLLNLFVRRFRPCWSLSPAELLALFACLLVTGSIPGQEFGIHFYLNLLAFLWHSRPGTPFAETILPHLDPKFLPGHRWNDPAVYLAYQGLPEGVAIPWRDWLLPLCLWTPYFLLLYGTLMLTAGLFVRRWEDEERLLYPLAQVPAAFADAQQSASLLRHPLFWLGFVAPCVLWSFRGLHQYFPAFPDLNLQPTTGALFSAGPATVFNDVPIEVRTDMIGLAYLLPLEVSLSGWLFYLLRRLQWMGRIYLGVTTGHAEFFTFQTMGAYAALALLLLWRNRTFLRHLVKSWGQSFPSSANPPLPPRWLLLGFLFGWVGLMVWCRFFGLAFPWGLVLLGSWFLGALVVARIICEAGLFIYGIPLSPPGTLNQVLFSAFGIDRIGVGNAVKMLAISWCQIRSSATNVLPNFFYAYKLGAIGGVNRTQLTGLLMAAVAVSLVTTHLTNLSVIYRFGVGKLSSWAQGAGFNSLNWLFTQVTMKPKMRSEHWRAFLLGAVVQWSLIWLRGQWLWFAISPLGWVMTQGWPMDRYWFSFFWGWLARALVTQFAGYSGWQAGRPFAFGLIVGTFFILTLWGIVHLYYPAPPVLME